MRAISACGSSRAPPRMRCHSSSTWRAKAVGAQVVHQDLDARLVDVVAPAVQVVDAQDGFQVAEQVLLGQVVADQLGEDGRAPLAAADVDGKAQAAVGVALQMQADIVHLDGGAVARGGRHGDLELARQEAELRVQRRPLADDLRVGARVGDLVGAGAGEVVGGDVADAVAGGLDGVHLHLRQLLQDVGDVGEPGPVELQVLAGGEVAGAAVVGPGDVGELAQLPRGQRAVGDGDAQHVGVELQVDAVHQPQRLELVLGELAREPAPDLVAKLGDALAHELGVELVVAVHVRRPLRASLPAYGERVGVRRGRAGRESTPARRRGCWGRRRGRARGRGRG